MHTEYDKSPEKSGLFFSTMPHYVAVSLLLHLLVAWLIFPYLSGAADRPSALPDRLEVVIRPSHDREISETAAKSLPDESDPKPSASQAPLANAPRSEVAPGVLSIARFHERDELTRQPHVVENVDLNPLQFHLSQSTAPLRLQLHVDASGLVVDIIVLAPSHATDVIDHAKSLLSKLRFSPGEIDGHPVGSKITIEVLLAPSTN